MPRLFLRDPVETLNHLGAAHLSFAAAMFVQMAVLVIVLACLDAIWLRRVRAVVRYGVWSLVLVKLMLPVWLQGPLSFTGWLDPLPQGAQETVVQRISTAVGAGSAFQAVASPLPGSAAHVPQTPSFDSAPAAAHLASAADTNPQLGQNPNAVFSGLQSISWQAWLFLGWLAGAALLFGLFVRRLAEARALVSAGVPATEELQALLRECQQRLGLEIQAIRLCVSEQLSTPAICGFWRATILLPRALVDRLSEEQLRLVFVHELAHWKRFDLQVNCLQTVLAIVYFYNPLVWVANMVLRRLREQAVDEAVLATMRSSAQRYSSTLLDIVALSQPSPEFTLRMVGVVESHKALPGRIRRILACPPTRSARLGFSGLVLVALAGVVLLPLAGRRALTIAQQPPTPAQQSAETKKEPKAASQNAPQDQKSAEAGMPTVAKDELAGVVQDEDGKPLAGVTVDAWHWHPGNETTTDANGLFRLKGFDSKRNVEVLLTKEGYSPQHFPQRPTGAKNWVVVLGRKTYFEGTVLGTDGQPVAGAAIRASFGPVQGDGFTMTEVPTEGKSREDGTYRLYVAPGTYDIQISSGPRGVFRQLGVAIKRDEAKPLPVQLQPGVRFEAKVVDSVTSKPVEGFILWQWRGPKLFARSDAEGRILLDGLIPGKTEFNCGGGDEIVHESGLRLYQHGPFGRWWSAEATSQWMRFHIDETRTGWQRNFDDLEFDLKVGMQHVTIVVEQGVTVSGRVTDPKGNGVAGATIAPARTGSGNSLTGDTRYSVRTEKDGSYHVVLPASNKTTYNLVVHDGDYQEWRHWANGVAEPMQTKPGQKIEGIDLQLSDPATIRGRVLVGGRPAIQREVRTHDFDKRENRYYDPTTQTKDDGTFELKFVRPGKHYLQAAPFWLTAESAPQGSKIVEVKAGETLDGIELVAAPEQRQVPPDTAALPFKARVLDAQRKPVADVVVGLGISGGIKVYSGAIQRRSNSLDVRSDEQGQAPLDTQLMGRLRQSASLVYAVDQEGRRAGITLLNLQDHVTADAKDAPVVDVSLSPAATVKVQIDPTELNQFRAKPSWINLSVTKDSLPLQQAALTEPGPWELLLPAGTYRVFVGVPYLAENSETEITIEAGKEPPEVTIPLKPSRMVQLIGQPAPGFAQLKANGETQLPRLEDLKGKVVVLDFWGYWCGPCVTAMPKLMEVYDEFHSKGVEFIAIHDDSVTSMGELRGMMSKLKDEHWNGRELPFTVLLDGGGQTPITGSTLNARGATTAAYGITSFPTTLVVDRQGRLDGQIHVHETEAVRQRLNDLLKANP